MAYSRLGISVPREAVTGVKNARLTLRAGFTSVRNVGAHGYTDVALRDGIDAGRCRGTPYARFRSGAWHHRRSLRQQLATLISLQI